MTNVYRDLITDLILYGCELLAEAAAIVLVLLVNLMFWLVPTVLAGLRDVGWLLFITGRLCWRLIAAASAIVYWRWKQRNLRRYSVPEDAPFITTTWTAETVAAF